MYKFYKKFLVCVLLLGSFNVFSQNVNVSIDLEKQRFLDNVSSLDRAKYFNIHNNGEEPSFPTFLKDNNVGLGRRFYGPFADTNFTNPRGNFSTTPATSDGIVRPVSRFVSTGGADRTWDPIDDPVAAANAAARYWVDEVDTNNRPEYWEPFNEPFIKANKFTSGTLSNDDVVTLLSEWFRDMAKGIHATPELANMKVIGFSSAFPSYARRDFSETWQNHMKKFIDIAGADMDAISVHPYDGVNQVGQSNGRSGSNSEAILDLIETYSNQVLGKPSKLAITEFGVIEQGFPEGPAPGFYNESANAITIRGFNNMLFNFFERQDIIEICIPFVTGRADFHYNRQDAEGNPLPPSGPYVPAIIRPTEIYNVKDPITNAFRNNTWVLTFKQNFYKFWKDIKGNRAKITSDDLDVQVQAFVDGNTVFIALNNLDESDKTVNLNFLTGATNVTNVNTSSLIINAHNPPVYNSGTDSGSLPTSISLLNGETKILKITYSSPVQFTSSIIRKKYYATSAQASINKAPTVLITADEDKTFTLTNVVKGTNGDATLRISVGIPLKTAVGSTTPTGLDRLPSEITFNSNVLPIPTNWKGYDQDDRTDFYGMFELNIPFNLVNNGDNTVTIKYAKTGGRIAAVVLSLESDDGLCTASTLYADEDGDGLGNPAVSIESCGPVRGFVDNSDDNCIDDIENVCLAVEIPGIVEAEEFTENNGVVVNGTFIESINNGDSSTYDVKNNVPGSMAVTIKASAATGAGGTVAIFRGTNELASIPITSTGDINTFQDFSSNITIDSGNLTRLRFEYSGTGTGDLFNIDSIEFETNEAFVAYANPESESFALTITDSQTSFSIDVLYAIKKSNQSADFNLRNGGTGVTGGFATIKPGAPAAGTGTFNINLSGPLPVGEYDLLIFINSPGDTPQFFGGPNPQLKLKVIEPAVDAANDESKNNPRGSIISLNILSNDKKEDGTTPLPNEVTIDIDPTTAAVDTTLPVTNEGTWNYNATNGELSFTPNAGFVNNPTDITYSLTEIANSLSDNGTVNFEYIQPPTVINDTSNQNTPGAVEVSILSNDIADNGTTLNAASVTIDLDPTTIPVETTLDIGVIGNWSYNITTGILTFTPGSDFSGNPPSINYKLTETATGLSATASVTVTYNSNALAEFKVENTGETCASENNGTIEVIANIAGNYSVEITGIANSKTDFTENIVIENLEANEYSIVVTDKNTNDIFDFKVQITEPEDVSAKTKIKRTAKQLILDLSGSENYTVTLNGQTFTTSASSLTLSLNSGTNDLLIKGDKECQGNFSKKIVLNDTKLYPIPVIDILKIETLSTEQCTISTYSISSKLISVKKAAPNDGIIELNMSDLAPGMYFIKIQTNSSTTTHKIIK